MKIHEMMLGGQDASRFLASMIEGNRTSSAGYMSQYVVDMLSGDWVLTGDPIKFNDEGAMFDGGHRMRALQEACRINPDLRVPFLVAEDVDKRAYAVVDTGRKRSNRDGVSMHTRGEYGGQSMAVVKAHWQYIHGNKIIVTGANTVSPTRTQEFHHWESDPDGFEAAYHRGKDANKIKLGFPRVGGLFYYLLSTTEGISQDAKHEFFDQFIGGAELARTSPILSLRTRLQSRGMSRSNDNRYATYTAGDQLYLYHRTWEAWCKDENVKITLPRYRIDNKTFPKLYVPKADS